MAELDPIRRTLVWDLEAYRRSTKQVESVYRRMLKTMRQELKKLREEFGKPLPTPGGSGGDPNKPATEGAKKARAAMRRLRLAAKEAKKEFDQLRATYRAGELSNEKYARSVEKLKIKSVREIAQIRNTLTEVPKAVEIEIGRSLTKLYNFNQKAKEQTTGKTPFRQGIQQGVRDGILSLGGRVPGLTQLTGLNAVAGGLTTTMLGLGAAGVVVGDGLRRATMRAIRFENELTGARKTMGLTRDEARALGDDILDLSADLGQSELKLAAIAEQAGQLGIRGRDNVSAFVSSVAMVSETMELSAEAAAKSAGDIAAAYGIPIPQLNNLFSAINELSNETNASGSQIIDFVRRVAPQAALLGVSAENVAAIGASLVETGLRSERAGTSVLSVLGLMQSRAGDLAQALGIAEHEVRSLITEDTVGLLRRYLAALSHLEPTLRSTEIRRVFGQENVAVVQTLTKAITTQVGEVDKLASRQLIANKASREGVSIQQEFLTTLDTTTGQWALLTQNVKAAATSIGGPFNRALKTVLEGFNQFFDPVGSGERGLLRISGELERLEEAEELLKVYNELAGRADLSAEENDKLQAAIDTLTERFPAYVSQVRDANGALTLYATSLQDTITLQSRLLRSQQQGALRTLIDEYEEAAERIDRLNEKRIAFLDQEKRLVNGETVMGSTNAGGAGVAVPRTHSVVRQDLDETTDKLTRIRSEAEKSATALRSFFATAEGDLDLSALTEFLSTSTRSLEEAKALAKDIFTTLNPGADFIGPRRVAFDSKDDPSPTNPTPPPTLSAQIQAARDQVEALQQQGEKTEALAAANQRLNALLERQRELRSFGLPDHSLAQREKEIQQQLILSKLSGDQLKIQEQLFRKQAELAKLEADMQKLQDPRHAQILLEALIAQEAKLQQHLTATRDIEAMWQNLPESVRETITALGGLDDLFKQGLTTEDAATLAVFVEQVNAITKAAAAEIEPIRVHLNANPDDEEAHAALADAARRYNEQLREAFASLDLDEGNTPLLKAANALFSVMQRGLKAVTGETKNTAKESKAFLDNLEGYARAARSILTLADAFGILSDEMRIVISGAADALDNLNQLNSVIDKQGSLGAALGTTQGLASAFGVAAGLTSLTTGVIGAIRAQRDEAERLRRQLRDSSREIAAAMEGFFEGGQIGSDTSRQTLTQAQGIIRDILGLDVGQRGQRESLLADLEATGLAPFHNLTTLAGQVFDTIEDYLANIQDFSKGDVRKSVDAILFGDGTYKGVDVAGLFESLQEGIDLPNISGFLADAFGGLGTFSRDVAGAVEQLQFFTTFVGEEAVDTFDQFLTFLLTEVDGLGDGLRARLENAAGLDLATQEGRAQLEALIEEIALLLQGDRTGIVGGKGITEDVLGALTPAELESLLSALKGFTQDGSSSPVNRTTQVANSITEVQGNQVVVLLEEILYAVRDLGASTGDVPTIPDTKLPGDLGLGDGIGFGEQRGLAALAAALQASTQRSALPIPTQPSEWALNAYFGDINHTSELSDEQARNLARVTGEHVEQRMLDKLLNRSSAPSTFRLRL